MIGDYPFNFMHFIYSSSQSAEVQRGGHLQISSQIGQSNLRSELHEDRDVVSRFGSGRISKVQLQLTSDDRRLRIELLENAIDNLRTGKT